MLNNIVAEDIVVIKILVKRLLAILGKTIQVLFKTQK